MPQPRLYQPAHSVGPARPLSLRRALDDLSHVDGTHDDGDDDGVAISTAHPGVERACGHLAAVLVGVTSTLPDAAGGGVDPEVTWDVSEAVLELSDVHPPLPPLAYPETGPRTVATVRQQVASAAAELAAVVERPGATADAGEALRCGRAHRLLRRVLRRLDAAEH